MQLCLYTITPLMVIPPHSLFSLFYYQKYYSYCLTFSFSIYSQLDEKDDTFPPFTGYSFLNSQDNPF